MNFIQKFVKYINLEFKLLFATRHKITIETKEVVSTNSNISVIEPAKIVDTIQQVKEDKWFKRANNLIEEFVGDPPIVYEADMRTVKKENQYGYIPPEGEMRVIYDPNEPQYRDNIDLLKSDPNYAAPNIPSSTTADYLTKSQEFEERWKRIQKKVEEDASIEDQRILNRELENMERLEPDHEIFKPLE